MTLYTYERQDDGELLEVEYPKGEAPETLTLEGRVWQRIWEGKRGNLFEIVHSRRMPQLGDVWGAGRQKRDMRLRARSLQDWDPVAKHHTPEGDCLFEGPRDIQRALDVMAHRQDGDGMEWDGPGRIRKPPPWA